MEDIDQYNFYFDDSNSSTEEEPPINVFSDDECDLTQAIPPNFSRNDIEHPPPDLTLECKEEPPPLFNFNFTNQKVDINFAYRTNFYPVVPPDQPFYLQQSAPMILNSLNKEFANSFNLANSKPFKVAKQPKRKVSLSAKEQKFKKNLYSVFTSKKKFPKECLKKIHDEHIAIDLDIPKMSREQLRRIDLYFRDFASFSDLIIPYLKQNKGELSYLVK